MFKLFRTQTELHSLRQIIKWLWYASQGSRKHAVLNVLLGLLGVLVSFAFIWATKLTIDIASGQTSVEAQHSIVNLGGEQLYQFLYRCSTLEGAAILLVAILIFQLLLGLANRWVKALLGVKAQNKMQQRIFTRLLNNEWSGVENYHSGDVLNRLERDVKDVVTLLTETLPNFITVCVQLLCAFFFLYLLDAKLAFFCIVAIPFFMLLSRAYFRKMRALTKEIRRSDSKVQSLLQESVQHRLIIKTMEHTQAMLSKLSGLHLHLRQQVIDQTKLSTFSSTMLGFGFSSVYLATFIWSAMRLQEGSITYGSMMAFIQLVGQIQGPFRSLTTYIPSFITTFTASERLIELEKMPEEPQGKPISLSGEIGVRFSHVSYAYDKASRKIFDDFSFDFPPCSRTAILGETGAGKTTLTRLILALIHPNNGVVELYNEKMCTTSSAHTRCNFVYVPQGNTLFSGTIRDNLRMGNPEATEQEMRKVLEMACAEFVFDLPQQLDTLCGEFGGGFSEGQAQRIAIARALLRPGAIILFDEATSALDMQTEQRLLSNLVHNAQGKTLLFITHRHAVIDHCTQVLTIEA